MCLHADKNQVVETLTEPMTVYKVYFVNCTSLLSPFRQHHSTLGEETSIGHSLDYVNTLEPEDMTYVNGTQFRMVKTIRSAYHSFVNLDDALALRRYRCNGNIDPHLGQWEVIECEIPTGAQIIRGLDDERKACIGSDRIKPLIVTPPILTL